MAEEEDDDMYGSGETAGQEGPSIAEAEAPTQRAPTNSAQIVKEDEEEEEEEDDDDEEEEDDSDVCSYPISVEFLKLIVCIG